MMPLDNNPHQWPRHFIQDQLNFVLRPYPTLRWNVVPRAALQPELVNLIRITREMRNGKKVNQRRHNLTRPRVQGHQPVWRFRFTSTTTSSFGPVEVFCYCAILGTPDTLVEHCNRHNQSCGWAPTSPPKKIWMRSFENLMDHFAVTTISRSLMMRLFGLVICSKQNWDISFNVASLFNSTPSPLKGNTLGNMLINLLHCLILLSDRMWGHCSLKLLCNNVRLIILG